MMSGVGSSTVSSFESAGHYNPADDPFYVSLNEVTGSSLVSEVLIGRRNFVSWKKAMEIALSARMKIGFVLGQYPRPADDSPMLARWQLSNDVVMSWLISSVSKQIVSQILHAEDVAVAWRTLHIRYSGSNLSRKFALKKDIWSLMQGDMDVASYIGKLTNFWEDLDAMRGRRHCYVAGNCLECRENAKERLEDRAMQFLFGLNDMYSQVRTHILALDELPNIDKIYDMVTSHEAEYNLTKLSVMEASAMYAKQNNYRNQNSLVQHSIQSAQPVQQGTNVTGGNKQRLFCTHCKMSGHGKETCYKLIGYPVGHKLYKGPARQNFNNFRANQQNGGAANGAMNENASKTIQGFNSEPGPSGMQFTEAQVNKGLAMIKGGDTTDDNSDVRMADSSEAAELSTVNPLTPTSDNCSITDALAMDCEMVGVGANQSALARVTLVNEWGNVVYDEYVCPVEHVVDYRTEISGIRPHHLKEAKKFQVAQEKVAEMLKGRILVGHALHHDLKALLLSHPTSDIRDTAVYLPFLKKGQSRALRHLAEELLGVKIQNGEHCSIEDARAAMLIYQNNKKKWEKFVKKQLRHPKKPFKGRPKNMRKNISSGTEAAFSAGQAISPVVVAFEACL
ncbi:unnamed protein product [Rhodiola kirilowii]